MPANWRACACPGAAAILRLSLSITQNGITDVLPIQAKSGDAIDLPACVAGDSIFVTYEGQTVADAANGVLESILDQLAPGSSNGSTGPFWQATQPVSLATVPLAAGAALDTSLQSILTALQAQRSDTLWTDDSGAFYIRTDDAGTITWFTISGGASSAPGTGARPAAGASIIVDSSRYQAMTAATGYSVGDYLSHVVTTDPNTGAILGHFWINVTTNAKLASDPASANITPISPLATGAATLAQQLAEAGILTSILAACLASTPPGTALIGSVDTVIKSAAADRGAIIGFTGAVFTPVNGTNTVTLTTAPTVGSVQSRHDPSPGWHSCRIVSVCPGIWCLERGRLDLHTVVLANIARRRKCHDQHSCCGSFGGAADDHGWQTPIAGVSHTKTKARAPTCGSTASVRPPPIITARSCLQAPTSKAPPSTSARAQLRSFRTPPVSRSTLGSFKLCLCPSVPARRSFAVPLSTQRALPWPIHSPSSTNMTSTAPQRA